MARGTPAYSSACDPRGRGANGHVAGFPYLAWPDSKVPWPPSPWLSCQRHLWERMLHPAQPRPFSPAPRACVGSPVPGERVIHTGRLPSPQLAELHAQEWACPSSTTQDRKGPRRVGVPAPGTSLVLLEAWLLCGHASDAA